LSLFPAFRPSHPPPPLGPHLRDRHRRRCRRFRRRTMRRRKSRCCPRRCRRLPPRRVPSLSWRRPISRVAEIKSTSTDIPPPRETTTSCLADRRSSASLGRRFWKTRNRNFPPPRHRNTGGEDRCPTPSWSSSSSSPSVGGSLDVATAVPPPPKLPVRTVTPPNPTPSMRQSSPRKPRAVPSSS
jgi:hypothetical protein